MGAAAPWEVAVGGAFRLAAGDWNGWAAGRFRDERALLLAADLVLVGRTPQASGIESFAAGEMQASGRRRDAVAPGGRGVRMAAGAAAAARRQLLGAAAVRRRPRAACT